MNPENHSRPQRLAFVDLDDTLLGPDKRIGAENLAALERLRAAGTQIAFASGRHHENIVAMEAIGRRGWVLSSNGSIVRHEPTGEMLLEVTMQPDVVGEICERGRADGWTVIAYHREGAFVERHNAWTELYASKAGWMPRCVHFDELPRDGFQKILWSDQPARVLQTAPAVTSELAGRVNVLITNPELIEFFASAANKAAGAQALASRLGIGPAQALAFGDGSNDVELLQWAHVSVAMDHGREVARQAARFVSPTGDPESAFARAVHLALEHLN